ncbi:hypothetical protein [Bradyrhizobium sp. UFLA05-112]
MNQTIEHIWSTGLSLLSPGHLVDWLLDQIEKISPMMMPAQVDILSYQETRVEARRD